MKYTLIINILILILLVSCIKPKVQIDKSPDSIENIFNSSLLKELHKLIELKKEKEIYNKAICYVVLGNMYSDKQCYVFTSLNFGLDTARISGYTFLDDEFIACYILNDSCNNGLIKANNLLKSKEVIRNFYLLNQPMLEGNYDYPANTYKVVNSDSLVLIEPFEYK